MFCEKSPGERRSRGLEQFFLKNENGRFYVDFLSVQHSFQHAIDFQKSSFKICGAGFPACLSILAGWKACPT
jgi:hypothetical protein